MAFDTVKDFEPVVLADTVPLLLVVPASLPVTNVQELIAYVKAHPEEVSYASSGTGQIQHMSAELFKGMAGVEILARAVQGQHFRPSRSDQRSRDDDVRYGGGADAAGAGGHVAAAGGHHDDPRGGAPGRTHHDRGRCPGLRYQHFGRILRASRYAQGHRGEAQCRDQHRSGRSHASSSKLAAVGITVHGGTPDELGQFVQAELVKWAKVTKDANIVIEQ